MIGILLRGTAIVAMAALPFASVDAATSCTSKIVVSSIFSSGKDGWTSNTPSQVTWKATGGNPGGHLAFSDATGDSTYIIAPASYRGNYTTFNGNSYLTFQHKIQAEQGVESYSPYEIRFSGPGGAAKFDGALPIANTAGWVTVVAPIVSGDWNVTSGTWPALLKNVTSIQIDFELVTNQTTNEDQEEIDNIALVSDNCDFSVDTKSP